MGRLATAFLILMAALLGLTVIRSSNFRQSFLNVFGSSSQTQTTGFSTPVPTDGSNPVASNPQDTTQPPPSDNSGTSSDNSSSDESASQDSGSKKFIIRRNRRRYPIGAAW